MPCLCSIRLHKGFDHAVVDAFLQRPLLCSYVAGEIKHMSTGASPISTEVFEFLRVCFGATVSEGYGMTETSCTIAMTRPDDATMGHVGAPLDCCEIKLEDIPDMNYKNTDQPYPRGEVRPLTFPIFACSAVTRNTYTLGHQNIFCSGLGMTINTLC